MPSSFFRKSEANKKKNILANEYARSNNNVNVGDVVKDHTGFIEVKTIGVIYKYNGIEPMCVYYGPKLTQKDKKPFKNGSDDYVLQDYLKEHIPPKSTSENDGEKIG